MAADREETVLLYEPSDHHRAGDARAEHDLRDRIVAVLYEQGWTCDAHEPDSGCVTCAPLWDKTANTMLSILRCAQAEVAERIAQAIDDARRDTQGKAPGHYAGLAHAARIARGHRSAP